METQSLSQCVPKISTEPPGVLVKSQLPQPHSWSMTESLGLILCIIKKVRAILIYPVKNYSYFVIEV